MKTLKDMVRWPRCMRQRLDHIDGILQYLVEQGKRSEHLDRMLHRLVERTEHLDGMAHQFDTKLNRILLNMSQMDDDVTQLVADSAAMRTVIDSAVAAFNGFAALIQKAVDDALAAGATPAQLQSMSDLHTAAVQQAADLAAAIPAGTPAANP